VADYKQKIKLLVSCDGSVLLWILTLLLVTSCGISKTKVVGATEVDFKVEEQALVDSRAEEVGFKGGDKIEAEDDSLPVAGDKEEVEVTREVAEVVVGMIILEEEVVAEEILNRSRPPTQFAIFTCETGVVGLATVVATVTHW
jgi:hypothetical protein